MTRTKHSAHKWLPMAVAGLALPMLSLSVAQATPVAATTQKTAHPETSQPMTAEAIIAQIDAAAKRWARSCKNPDPQGLCMTVKSASKDETSKADRCFAARVGHVKVHTRNAKLAKQAQQQLNKALKLAKTIPEPKDSLLLAAYREALGRAHVLKADQDFEAYMALTLPSDLEFYVEEWKNGSGVPKWEKQYKQQVAKKKASEKKFRVFFERKTKLAEQLNKSYREVLTVNSAAWIAPASLRTAWVALHMAEELRGATVPKSMSSPDVRAAYCDTLADQAKPTEAMARSAALFCVEKAATLKVEGTAVEACKELLDRIPAPPKTE